VTIETAITRAEAEQRQASDPAVSAFVSAHAGTGKTKLLIDRLLRLMFRGADPARILCLTFTRAAAAEMAIRLQQRLGAFVTMDDATLDAELKKLLVTPSAEKRTRARNLFAQVLDLPGGMRISTIHAFCQSLLRRFPLEAQLSPHFRLVEEADARDARDRAREAVLPRVAPELVAGLAGLVTADGFASLVAQLERKRDVLTAALDLPSAALTAAFRRAAGAHYPDEAALIEASVTWDDEKILRHALMRAQNLGSPAVVENAGALLGWLNLPPPLRAEFWTQWVEYLCRKDGEPFALSRFCNPKLAQLHGDVPDIIAAEQARVQAVRAQQRALRAAEASSALLRLAAPVLTAYEDAKGRGGLVEYDDLIRRSLSLLQQPGAAAWVKYKLDGGIDHVLLDEVQDTAVVQWDITDALTGDFFAGEGARENLPRTVFAVGDIKQSIYRFQGAEPAEFAVRSTKYERSVCAAGQEWRAPVLDVSFRSTAPVLATVDAVFADDMAASGVCGAGDLLHIARRVGQAGSVTLWPLAPAPDPVIAEPWIVPERNFAGSSAPDALVRQLADWIRERLDHRTMLQSAGRRLRAGDILVLVRRRGPFDRALVRELKKRAVPVAGLDRMMLTEQPAVQDLMSLCAALLLPQDDLSLAEFLTSPLGGLSDASLMALSAGRKGVLWDALRARAAEQPDWQKANNMFAALLSRVDYASPYALLAEALGPFGGRARLFARLGPEAAEPVDELLAAALHYAALHPASLQGFLHWLSLSGAEVKREAEAAGDTVRIMTVHGAKGLEAPLVILPDTVALPPDDDRLHWTTDPQTATDLFLWAPHKDFAADAVRDLRTAATASRMEEHNRLLYVALTRARDHLLVCGWQPRGAVPPESWYASVERGLRRAGAATVPHRWGEALELACEQTANAEPAGDTRDITAAALPDWAGAAPDWLPAPSPPEPPRQRPLSPSRPEGAALGAVPPARSPLQRVPADGGAMARGELVHALLQHLPSLKLQDREAAAHRFVRRAMGDGADQLATQVLALLDDARLAPLFGPGSHAEQALTGLAGDQIITGRIDRLAVLPHEVLVADYKTARTPPAEATGVPVRYVRQMAAYRAILGRIYPGRTVRCMLVYAEGPAIIDIPQALLDSHAPGGKT
jgi:ATP-dependent helicase/nuclease subunit A